MREFETKDGKINFVDEDDILVGFDNTGSCCENFGWFYSNEVPSDVVKIWGANGKPDKNTPKELENYFFDKNFYQKIEFPQFFDGGAAIVFKLSQKTDLEEIYLCIYNIHNGYYSHGFNMDVGGETLYSGNI